MNLLLSSLAFVAAVVLVLLLFALLVLMVRRRKRSKARQKAALKAQEAQGNAVSAEAKDVQFRAQGERGMGGPAYGDVLCGDGVYLPKVWESDFHTSFDGRWIRTGSYGGEAPTLTDRKSLRSWRLSPSEASALDAVQWRLPRWNEASPNPQRQLESGQTVFTDVDFDAWLAEQVTEAAQPLVALRDLWVAADQLPDEATQQAPVLTQPDESPVKLAMQRHWPVSLRTLREPLEPVQQPRWKLLFGDEAQPWAVDESTELVWRDDGKAFAFYGTPAGEADRMSGLSLVAWSEAHGWIHWSTWSPADRKSWSVGLCLVEDEGARPIPVPVLRWDGDTLLQRVTVDTPELERLHDGQNIHIAMSDIDGCAARSRDGRVRVQRIPRTIFLWRRHLAEPALWQAYSAPVAGKPLCWTLVKEASDVKGASAAYSLTWGDQKLSGLWELEHLVLQGRSAVLMQHGVPLSGEKNTIQIWNGTKLQTLATPWPVARLRAVPSTSGGTAEKLELIAVSAAVASNGADANAGVWRWHLQPANSNFLGRADWEPCYSVREAVPDAQGNWKVQPAWRTVEGIQHPCADGDYVWRLPKANDALWWLGGQHKNISNDWEPDLPRGEGVSITRAGAVLCGTGPSACPHPGGEGWVVLEMVARAEHEPHHWKLHWMQPATREVHTLALRAWLPLLRNWDGLGLHWYEGELPEGEAQTKETPTPKVQTIVWSQWIDAKVDNLYEGPEGLWMRKEDMRYAENLLMRDDWPWKRAVADVAAQM